MDLQSLKSPLRFLGELVPASQLAPLKDYESWWLTEGTVISEAVDRAGTPWLRMFDQFGKRTDEILFPPDYWKILKRGYQVGAIWRPFADDSKLTQDALPHRLRDLLLRCRTRLSLHRFHVHNRAAEKVRYTGITRSLSAASAAPRRDQLARRDLDD